MPKYLVCNYYIASIIHEVDAKDEDEALEKGRDAHDDLNELTGSLQYDESIIVK